MVDNQNWGTVPKTCAIVCNQAATGTDMLKKWLSSQNFLIVGVSLWKNR
jgi:hypothetical protein